LVAEKCLAQAKSASQQRIKLTVCPKVFPCKSFVTSNYNQISYIILHQTTRFPTQYSIIPRRKRPAVCYR